jgi:outer membrane protein assembly factor BamB
MAVLLTGVSALAQRGAPQPPYSWRGIDGSGVFPAKDLVSEFWDLAPDMLVEAKDRSGRAIKLDLPAKPGSRKNIVWRTALPHWGQNAPVVVKDRVFVMCDEGWKNDAPVLLCLDVNTGKILWQREVDHLDAWPADKAAEGRTWRAKDHEYWRAYMRAWNALYWDDVKNGWASKPEFRGRMIGPGQPENWVKASEQAIKQAKEAGFNMPEEWRVDVSGGWRSRYYWRVGTPQVMEVYNTCNKNRYHWYTGWTSEGPYFGSTMGSVVSDGQRIFAVTGLDAAACFDLDGKRLWVTDLEGKHILNYPASAPGYIQNHMSSPVLVDDKLVYYYRDGAVMYGLDAATGKIAWKTDAPKTADTHRDFGALGGKRPLGYQGHMGPGGTPVVMRLGGASVVVSGHGMAVRISDGKLLGQVHLPKGTPVAEGKEVVKAEEDYYGASYHSWAAHDDVLFYAPHGGLYAVQLGLDAEKLTQKVLWRLDAHVDSRDPNLVFHGGRLYAHASVEKRRGMVAIDAVSGKVLAWGPGTGGYTTSLGVAGDRAVWQAGYTGDGTEGKSDPATKPGHGMMRYVVVSLPDMKPLGSGYLCPEAPAGEVRDRHIARIGTARVVWGNAGVTCWGNRIFIRNNDYLWCIGDPSKAFVPPEAAMTTMTSVLQSTPRQ